MKKKAIALALAGVAVAVSLSGCAADTSRNVPATGSVEEAKLIVACAKAGGEFVPGNETSGYSYNSGCLFRYPDFKDNN